MPGQRTRLVGRFGERHPQRHPAIHQPRDKRAHQPRLIPPQMCAARDVEDEAIGRVHRDRRRVAVTILRNRVQQPGIGLWVMRHRLHLRHAGAGIGEHHARRETEAQRNLIDRHDAHGPGLLFGEDARAPVSLARFAGMVTQPSIGAQQRQEQGAIAPVR
jgi:hypothetical protein